MWKENEISRITESAVRLLLSGTQNLFISVNVETAMNYVNQLFQLFSAFEERFNRKFGWFFTNGNKQDYWL